MDKGILVQISGHKQSALVERHYTVRPIDILKEELQEYENWLFKEAKITLKKLNSIFSEVENPALLYSSIHSNVAMNRRFFHENSI